MESKEQFLSCKDYLVSGEEFVLFRHPDYEILVTKPVPESLQSYYRSGDYISHTDSRKSFTDKIYGLVKNYMLKKKLSWIEKIKPGGNILDIGAGTGDFLLEAKNKSWNVNGAEPSEDARKIAATKNINLKKDTSQFPTNSFDVITVWHVLEHVPDLDFQLNELKQLLKEDGFLVIAVPNYKSDDAEYYGEFWAAYDVPRHLWHFSQKGISKLFAEKNFELINTKALKFDSFYVSLLSEKYKPGSANFVMAFYRGLLSNIKAQSTSEYSSLVYFFKNSKKSF